MMARDAFPPTSAPLGNRADWTKPTVLLGSAGLKLAVAWKVKGGSGCTCMSPLAYGLRPHEIFEWPYKIDMSKTVDIPTPEDFKQEIKAPSIKVLPLVDDIHGQWKDGWCSYAFDFPKNPDVEYFCGGVNHKTPTAAGLWRQGNLLHFGFEQSPAEMNENGRNLLLNAIVYISRFSQDRPIAVTPSVFAGPVAPSRGAMVRHLRNPDFYIEWVALDVEPSLWAKIAPPDATNLAATAKNVMDHTPFVMPPAEREKMAKWFEQNGKFLHPLPDLRLDLDADLEALGVPFDDPTFLDKTITDLKGRWPECGARAAVVGALCAVRSGEGDGGGVGGVVEGEQALRVRVGFRRLLLVHRSVGEGAGYGECGAARSGAGRYCGDE